MKSELAYPVMDLVIVHGDFFSADREYVHENKSISGFGSYGDSFIRDRKMYVVPTPTAMLNGVIDKKTLIVPCDYIAPKDFECVGELNRIQADETVCGYKFDLKTNVLTVKKEPNSSAGVIHEFKAYRLKSDEPTKVTFKE